MDSECYYYYYYYYYYSYSIIPLVLSTGKRNIVLLMMIGKLYEINVNNIHF